MASEPTPKKKPEDESPEKDDLFAEELDDIDLDALLEEEEPAREEPLKAGMASNAVRQEDIVIDAEVIDDGEIDLLAEDDEGARRESVSLTGDVQEDLSLDDPGRQFSEDSEPVRVDGSTNGRPPGSDSDDLLADDESPLYDLLAEDDDLLKETPAVAPASPRGERGEIAEAIEPEIDLPDEAPAAEAADLDEEEMAAPVAEESKSAPEKVAVAPAGGKKPGRFGGGKGFKFGAKGKGPGKPAGKPEMAEGAVDEPADAPEAETAPATAPRRKAGKDNAKKEKVAVAAASALTPAAPRAKSTVPFVCSECYEEFLIPATYSQEMVSCPECLHVGKRPDADFLRTIHLHKSDERKSFVLAVGVGAVLLALLLALVWMVSPYGSGGGGGSMPMILLVASGLLAAMFVWLVVRFEGNRWEVYF